MTSSQLREHIAGCEACDVDITTMIGKPCDDARELADIAGVEIGAWPEAKDHHLAKFRRAVKMLNELTGAGFHLYLANDTLNLMSGPSHEGGRARQDRVIDSAIVKRSGGGDW